MDKSDRDSERRKQRRCEAVGTNNFVCIACGCPEVITAEGHHVAGRLFDKHIEYFCANCHRCLTEAQKSHAKASCKTPGAAECAGHYCLGLADIFSPASRMLDGFGNRLIQLADGCELTSDSAKSLIREVGHFLIALAGTLERIGQRLEHHGKALVDEANGATNGASKE